MAHLHTIITRLIIGMLLVIHGISVLQAEGESPALVPRQHKTSFRNMVNSKIAWFAGGIVVFGGSVKLLGWKLHRDMIRRYSAIIKGVESKVRKWQRDKSIPVIAWDVSSNVLGELPEVKIAEPLLEHYIKQGYKVFPITLKQDDFYLIFRVVYPSHDDRVKVKLRDYIATHYANRSTIDYSINK